MNIVLKWHETVTLAQSNVRLSRNMSDMRCIIMNWKLYLFIISEVRPDIARSDEPADFTAVLNAAVKRIRFITEESDYSDRSDSEFDWHCKKF